MESANKHWYFKWWGIGILFILLLFLIIFTASAFYIADLIKRGGLNQPGADNTSLGQTVTSDEMKFIEGDGTNFWLGSPEAKIKIIQFADFGCPYCAAAFTTLREISSNYKNDVKITFRDYPTVTGQSVELAMAARCAGEQGLFWPMHDKLFIQQGVAGRENLIALAKQIGADTSRFTACLDQEKYLSAIEKDLIDGQKLEITGTPTWFINGNRVEGNIPYETFIQIIERFLNN